MVEHTCPHCHGARLNDSILSVLVGTKNIYEVTSLSIKDLYEYLSNLKLNKTQTEISNLVIKEILERLKFLINVGLEYLSLSRTAATLSGGSYNFV